MINKSNEILSQTNSKMEEILKNTFEQIITAENAGKLSINTVEKIIGETIKIFISVILQMAGSLLSNISEQDELICECCKRKLRINKKSVPLSIMTLYGKVAILRNEMYCRYCGIGRGVNDNILKINKKHRITKGFSEIVTYVGQLIASFDEGAETIKKFLGFMGVETSASQIRIITEENGKKVFEKEISEAEEIYAKPEKYIPYLLDKDKKNAATYTLMDGSQVNTRVKDKEGKSWKEMKLVEGFCDKDIQKRKNGDSIIVKKQYGTFLGGVESFKKVVLKVAAETGYGIYKKHVVLGDGAAWIWNMSKELFPDAIEILDFYHVIENTYEYAKMLYPNNDKKRMCWINKVLTMLEKGKEEEAIQYVNNFKMAEVPKGIVNLPKYLENNKMRIKYKEFKEAGYYIGSGAIESGNKTVIQQRMKQAGMRWNVKDGQYIAVLRAKYKSNLWNEVIETIGA
jgi:hypothetical protein